MGGGSGGGSGSGTGGGGNGGGGTATDPAQTFNAKVQPLVTACVGCHGGGQPPNLSSYANLETRYKTKPGASNILVTKAAAGAQHHGTPYFSTADKQVIAGWIDSL